MDIHLGMCSERLTTISEHLATAIVPNCYGYAGTSGLVLQRPDGSKFSRKDLFRYSATFQSIADQTIVMDIPSFDAVALPSSYASMELLVSVPQERRLSWLREEQSPFPRMAVIADIRLKHSADYLFRAEYDGQAAIAYRSLFGTGDGTIGVISLDHSTQGASVVDTQIDVYDDSIIKIDDLDQDGAIDDVVVADSGGVRVYGSYLNRRQYAIGGDIPNDVLVADVNNDGKPDIILTHSSTKRISILLAGATSGRFLPVRFINLNYPPSNMAVADFDKDGQNDLAVTSQSTGTVRILRGLGAGSFAASTIVAPLSEPTEVLAQSDGSLWILEVGSRSVVLLQSKGDGSLNFDRRFSTPIGLSAASLKKGIGDGFTIANRGSRDVYASEFHPYTAGLARTAIDAGAKAVALGDLNHDGHLDAVAVGMGTRGLAVLLGSGSGLLQPWQLLPEGGSALEVRDVDGDGNLDVVTWGGSAGVWLFRGDGKGNLTADSSWLEVENEAVALVDVDRDGALDAVSTRGKDIFLTKNIAGSFPQNKERIAALSDAGQLAVGDLEGDGTVDICVLTSAGDHLNVLRLDARGGLRSQSSVALQGSQPAARIALHDVNGDGNLDALVTPLSGAGGGLQVLLGSADGSLRPWASLFVPEGSSVLRVADYNQDGVSDLVLISARDHSVTVLQGDGHGRFVTALRGRPVVAPVDVAVGDMDHDGMPDLVLLTEDAVSVAPNLHF